MARYPTLNAALRKQLERIQPSVLRGVNYYPCAAKLVNGDILSCVCLVQDEAFIKLCGGVDPESFPRGNRVLVQEVADVSESPLRLPARCARKLRRHGESGMGYFVFTVVFTDLSRQAYGGGSVDFIQYPEGKGPKNVLWVIPHEGKQAESILTGPAPHWCLYSEAS